MNLHQRTLDLLAKRGDLTLKQIAKGAGVTPSWLYKLHQDALANPTASRLQAVHDFLLKRTQEAA